MDHVTRHITRLVCLPLLLFLFSAVVDGQDRRGGRRPSSGPSRPASQRAVARRD